MTPHFVQQQTKKKQPPKTTGNIWVKVIVLNATFNNISVISWLSVGTKRTTQH